MRSRILKSHHLEHLADLGYVNFPLRVRYEQEEFDAARAAWERTGITDPKLLDAKALGHIYHRQQQQKDVSLTERAELHQHLRSLGRFVKVGLGAIFLLLVFIFAIALDAHCQFSHVNTISATDGTNTVFSAAPFKITFSGCTVGGTGSAWTITCAGSAANPGGSAHQLQVNSAGTAFAGIANGTAGQVLCSNGSTLDPAMCDPIVSGPDAVAATPTKNPVQVGCVFLTTPTTLTNNQVGELECDNGQNLLVKVSNTVPVSQSGTWTVQPGNTANTTAWKVDGSAVTQPVSSADGSQVTIGAKADAKSTATDTTAITMMQVLKEISAMEQAPASRAVTNAGTFAVQIAANSSVNVAQLAGTTTDTNSGTKSAGTLRVVLATDQPALTNKLLVTPDSVALPANQSVNINQVAGAATSATNPLYIRETDATNAVVLDPCRTQANIFKPISQTASAQLVTGTSAKKIYICSINLVTASANNVAMVEGTGTVCATGIAGMAGGTTAATGWNFAANGGLTQGNGMGSIMAEATNADNLCLLQSAAVQLSGVIGYVVQ
jgi:hypothetical protein